MVPLLVSKQAVFQRSGSCRVLFALDAVQGSAVYFFSLWAVSLVSDSGISPRPV